MNGVLLLAGLSPLILGSIIFLVKSKRFVLPVLTLLVCGAVAAGGFLLTPEKPREELSEEWIQYLAELNLKDGNLEIAEEYAKELYASSGDTAEALLTLMRLELASGDMNSAMALSKALSLKLQAGADVELSGEEARFVESVNKGEYQTASQLMLARAMYDQLAASDVNPEDYGYKKVTKEQIEEAQEEEAELVKAVFDALKKDIKKFGKNELAEALDDVIDRANDITMAYAERYHLPQEEYLDDMKNWTKDLLELYREYPETFDLPEVREAFILGSVVAKQYESLIEYAAESGDEKAWASIFNLYVSKEIKKSDLQDVFADGDYNRVFDTCSAVMKDLDEDDIEAADYERLSQMTDAVEERCDKPVLAGIAEQMNPEAVSEEEKAGAYIQYAGVSSELEDKIGTREAMDNALAHRYAAEDSSLRGTLEDINDIVENTGETDRITDLNGLLAEVYVQTVTLPQELVTVPQNFENDVNEYANERRAMINVGIVNTDAFPVVKMYVSTTADLRGAVVNDCGINITDYTIEKVKYDSANIVLVCDNSGSMSGDIEELKNAVTRFVEAQGKGENIGIITFDGGVLQNTGAGADRETLQAAIDAFGAYGGTYIKGGVDAAFSNIGSGSNSFNVVIVMTDGQDSSYNYQETLNQLRVSCNSTNTVLYTIGLGEVNADYLTHIADAGMGSFIYSSDSIQLADLYSFIHNQLDNNYCVTFTAKDITTVQDREVFIQSADGKYHGSRTYSLTYNTGEQNQGDAASEMKDHPKTAGVTGLGTSTVIKGSKNTADFTILGYGFESVEEVFIALDGEKKYSGLTYTVTTDGMITVELPENIAYGTYNVKVHLDGSLYLLENLKVLEETELTKVTFGDYVFEAYSVETKDNTTVLSGNVVMNDYLHFYGDVTLLGDLNADTVFLEEYSGSYIKYREELKGLWALCFDNVTYIPPLVNISLYQDEDTFDKRYLGSLLYFTSLEVQTPYVELHPEYVAASFTEFELEIPFMDDLLALGEDEELFSMEVEEKQIIFGNTQPGIVFEAEVEINSNKAAKLGPARLSVSKISANINTFESDYKLGMEVGLEGVAVFSDPETSYSFEVGIKEGRFDSLDLGADIDITVCAEPPITLYDFHAGVENMAGEEQDASIGSRMLSATWYGQCDVGFFKLTEVVPVLDVFGDVFDVSVLALDDTKLALTIRNFGVSLETKATFLDNIELGAAKVELGNYSYENALLDIDSNVVGVGLEVSRGLEIDLGNIFSATVDGAHRVDVNNKFVGLMSHGGISYDANILVWSEDANYEGDLLFGVQNLEQLVIIAKGTESVSGEEVGARLVLKGTKNFPFIDPDLELY